MGPISGSRGCLGPQLAACGAAVQLWKRRPESNVYHECHRGCQLQFPESNEKRLFPQRGCGTQGTLSAYNRIIQKMEQPSYTQLGYGQKPAFHGWQDTSPDIEIWKFLRQFLYNLVTYAKRWSINSATKKIKKTYTLYLTNPALSRFVRFFRMPAEISLDISRL